MTLCKEELERRWRLLEIAPRLVDPWPDEPGKYAAWLLVRLVDARREAWESK
jgi:hypothetical protein